MSNLKVSSDPSFNTQQILPQSHVTDNSYTITDTKLNIQKVIEIEQLRNNNIQDDDTAQIQTSVPTINLLISQKFDQQLSKTKNNRSFSDSIKKARAKSLSNTQTSVFLPINVPSQSPINQQQSFKHEITEFLHDFYSTQSQIMPLSSRAVSVPSTSLKSSQITHVINNSGNNQINKSNPQQLSTIQLTRSSIFMPQDINQLTISQTSQYIDENVKSRLQNNISTSSSILSSSELAVGNDKSQTKNSQIGNTPQYPVNSQIYDNSQKSENIPFQTNSIQNSIISNHTDQLLDNSQKTKNIEIQIDPNPRPKYMFLKQNMQQTRQDDNILIQQQQVSHQVEQMNISTHSQSLTQSQMSLSQYVEQNQTQYQYENQQAQQRTINAIKLIQDKYRCIGFKTQLFVSLRILNGLSQKYGVKLSNLTMQTIIFRTPYCGLRYENCINDIRKHFYKVIYAAMLIKYKYMFTRMQMRSVINASYDSMRNPDKQYYFSRLENTNLQLIQQQIYNASVFYAANLKRYFQAIKTIQKYINKYHIIIHQKPYFISQQQWYEQQTYDINAIYTIQKIFKKITISRQIICYAFIYYNIFQLDKQFFTLYIQFVNKVLQNVDPEEKQIYVRQYRFMLFASLQFSKQLNIIKNYAQKRQKFKKSIIKIQRFYRKWKEFKNTRKIGASKFSSIYNTNRMDIFNNSDVSVTSQDQQNSNTKDTLLKAFQIMQQPFNKNNNQMHLTAALLIYNEIERYLLNPTYSGPYTAAEITSIMLVDNIFVNIINAVKYSSEQLRPKAFIMLIYYIEFNVQVYIKHQDQLDAMVKKILKSKSYYCVCQAKFVKKLTKLNKNIITEKDGQTLMTFYIRIKKILNNLGNHLNDEKQKANKQDKDQQTKQYKLLQQLRQHIKGILYYSQQHFQ